MHSSSLILLAVVLIIAVYTSPISGKATKKPATTAAAPTTTSTTTTTTIATTKIIAPAKPAKADKKKKKGRKKSKKPKKNPWSTPTAEQKKLFNDYKTILRAKLNARNLNVSNTFDLEPARAGSQEIDKTILHHFLIKLPDSKYAHAIIGTNKDAKKSTQVNEQSASIRRTIHDTLQAAGA